MNLEEQELCCLWRSPSLVPSTPDGKGPDSPQSTGDPVRRPVDEHYTLGRSIRHQWGITTRHTSRREAHRILFLKRMNMVHKHLGMHSRTGPDNRRSNSPNSTTRHIMHIHNRTQALVRDGEHGSQAESRSRLPDVVTSRRQQQPYVSDVEGQTGSRHHHHHHHHRHSQRNGNQYLDENHRQSSNHQEGVRTGFSSNTSNHQIRQNARMNFHNFHSFLERIRHHQSNNFSDLHGVATQILHLRANPSAIIAFMLKYLPFLLIFLTKLLYDYREKVLLFFDLLVTFSHANSVVKREAIKQSHRSLYALTVAFFNLIGGLVFVYSFKQDLPIRNPYIKPQSAFELLWIVGVNDFVIKLITVMVKLCLVALPCVIMPYRSRGHVFVILEAWSQLNRSLAPIPSWVLYLLNTYQGKELVMTTFLLVLYIICKVGDVWSKFLSLRLAFSKLGREVPGCRATREQLQETGSQCPICCDEYRIPIILRCGHIFCEACLASWFDRKQTCPLCRAPVGQGWKDGATTYIPQLY